MSVAFVGEPPSSLDELPLCPPSLLLFSAPPFLLASGAFFPLQLHFRFSLINLFTCWCKTKKKVAWWNVFLLNFVKKKLFPYCLHRLLQFYHRPESRDISRNFKRTPSAKFETMISEPRPKKGKKTAKTVQNGLRFSRFRSNCIKIISVSISILYRKDVNKNTKPLLTL